MSEPGAATKVELPPLASPSRLPVVMAKIVDNSRCIGCHACTVACKSENEVPVSVTRTYVKYAEVGRFPAARRVFQVTRCNQCQRPPCATACPTRAMFVRADGIVDFDKSICIGCKACIAACPYDAIFINPEDHSAEKCNFCAHRLDQGLEPACVVVCPTEAIIVGDLNDASSRLSQTMRRTSVSVRRPEKETLPKLFYVNGHQATLDPIAAKRPAGGLFMWSEQLHDRSAHVVSGHPQRSNSSAAALLSYDVPHAIPWRWQVSLYTWTKGIAAGAYLVSVFLLLTGVIRSTGPMWRWAAPALSAVFLAFTGALLIGDLEHPTRFHLIFLRPQWKSWLVRGAFIIAAFAAVLILHGAATLLRRDDISTTLAVVGAPLAVLTAVYTAYLFAQAKARDLWQSPALPLHMAVQAVALGSAALIAAALWFESSATHVLLQLVGVASGLQLALIVGDITLTHATAHARLAVAEMIRGQFRLYFLIGIALLSASMFAPLIGPIAALTTLIAVMAYDHAYVQAGQSVALA